jgi:iron complex outermembrane receptor protein
MVAPRLLLLLCAAWPLLAGATHNPDESAYLDEDDYLGEMPTVLTVSRLAQPIDESPAAVTVIDEETIRASGIVDLADIFRLVPGMYVGHNAGYFHTVNPSVSYHGLTDSYSRRMQVLVDGRSVYAPLYGGVQWSDIPLAIEDIARIEVTRGPNSASYGANSFFGVINIITQHSSETLGNTAVLTTGGDRKGITLRHGGKVNDLSYRITVNLKNDDGLPQRVDDKRIRMFNYRADYRASDRDEFEFQFGYNGGDRQEGLLEEDPVMYLPRTKEVTSHFQQINWRRKLDDDAELRIQAYHSYDKSDDDVVSADLAALAEAKLGFPIPLPSPYLRLRQQVIAERYDLEAQHSFSPGKSTRLVWGGSVRLDRMQADHFLESDGTNSFRLGRLFGHMEWRPLSRLVLNAGAMLEDNSLTGSDITPRASASWKVAPGHTLRAGISTATRTPTPLEEKFRWRVDIPTLAGFTGFDQLYYDRGGLSPERITSRELGYLGNFGPLSLDTRLFHDKIKNVITEYATTDYPVPPGYLDIDPEAFSSRNSSDINVHGFEMQAQLRLGTHTRVIANYAHVRIDPDMDATFINSGERRRFKELNEAMPINSGSVLAWHRFGRGWMASVGYYYSGEMEMPGDGNQVDAARHWDMRIARSFKLGRTNHEIALTSQNVLDQEYNEFARYNTLERRTHLQYRVDF